MSSLSIYILVSISVLTGYFYYPAVKKTFLSRGWLSERFLSESSVVSLSKSEVKQSEANLIKTSVPTQKKTQAEIVQQSSAAVTADSKQGTGQVALLNEGQIIEAMKRSMQSKKGNSFVEQYVKAWKVAKSEFKEGQMAQIGIMEFQRETLFGMRTFLAKAVFVNGKINQWYLLKSGNILE